ncbi:aminoglycoside phosphotransferase family protein [Serpentinicella alkaliphila]|uniref:Phosphotransferase family enzyme n=1 Tax=Serpentinicella alkaliphila TaxID=1734049 RepID=A0A4R2TJL4_9FIRM|nr:aminoglycoside phosphotransferase family protein [Serpentinicella alkaliphila]QUH24592.1 aminoglycoside phosphotransferase family protein [Serpentinicella alkaliphila]TCQ02587.1 phosphotransferase family enzyme [Serpentinicella alkaliphila]
MLINTLEVKIRDYVKANDLRKYLTIENHFKVKFLAQGEYNINFTLEDKNNKYVFRVNTGSQLELENQIKYEYNALKSLESSSVTPKVFFVDDTKSYFDYGILIMEYLEGRPLEYDKDLKKAAKVFSRIHSIDVNSIKNNFITEHNVFTDRIDEGSRLLREYLKSPKPDKKLKIFFEMFLDWAQQNKDRERYFADNKWLVINNTEVNSHNFIIGPKNNYLIDWEKPVISDPCQDLSQFLAPTTTLWKANYLLSEEEKNTFFRTYIENLEGKDRHIKERVRLYNPYLYLRALSWCAYAWLEYQKPDKEIKNMDTFRKIQEYLDIYFMKNLLKDYFKVNI